jgi:hypothetical protein
MSRRRGSWGATAAAVVLCSGLLGGTPCLCEQPGAPPPPGAEQQPQASPLMKSVEVMSITGEWGACDATTCERYRLVICSTSDGRVVSDALCGAALPAAKEACESCVLSKGGFSKSLKKTAGSGDAASSEQVVLKEDFEPANRPRFVRPQQEGASLLVLSVGVGAVGSFLVILLFVLRQAGRDSSLEGLPYRYLRSEPSSNKPYVQKTHVRKNCVARSYDSHAYHNPFADVGPSLWKESPKFCV